MRTCSGSSCDERARRIGESSRPKEIVSGVTSLALMSITKELDKVISFVMQQVAMARGSPQGCGGANILSRVRKV
jgi:hypothetical protein